MADEREGQELNPQPAAKEGHVQSQGRRENAAQPLATDKKGAGGAERYPDADQPRSFEPKVRNETAPAKGQDDAPSAANDGRMGPGGDPAEGKR